MKKFILLFFATILLFCCTNEIIDLQAEPPCDNGAFVGDVILKTQEEVDDFGALCYSKIEGNLLIGNPDFDYSTNTNLTNIESLISLSGLLKIEDGLTIQGCPLLRNLKGFDSLISIGEIANLVIFKCSSLSTIAQLSTLVNNNTESSIEIIGNDSLSSLNGLEGFTSAHSIFLIGNDLLLNLEGLHKLEALTWLAMHYNSSLISFDEIQSVTTLKRLEISGNNSLVSLDAVNLSNSLTDFRLKYNNSITSLDEIRGAFSNDNVFIQIKGNDGLTTLGNISSIQSVFGFEVEYNVNLESLGAFPNLSEARKISIKNNANLSSLDGLENLMKLDQFWIRENNSLLNFCALQNLFINGTYTTNTYSYALEFNAYNPTIQDIIDGNCSQ